MVWGMSLTLNTMKSSDLSRNPNKVYSEAEKEPVLLTRRDGEDLVVMTAKEAASRTWLMELAAQIMGVATSPGGTLVERMCSAFPWMLVLSQDEREKCVTKILESTRISLSTGHSLVAYVAFHGWKDSAEYIAAGMVEQEVDWLQEQIIVERPA